MSRSHAVPALILGIAVLGTVFKPEIAMTKTDEDVSCEIRATPFAGGVRLEGVARSKSPVTGSYELTVTKIGGGGSSSNVQGGEFAAGPGEDGVLSEVSLGLDGGASYEAVLTLEWDGGTAKCEKRSPSRT